MLALQRRMPPLPVVALAGAVLTSSSIAQQPFRVLPDALPTPRIEFDVGAGDVDGDGDVDLVTAAHWDGARLYLNDGRGRFVDATQQRVPFPGSSLLLNAFRVDLADIDGDGDLNLLLGQRDTLARNRVYRNDGQGFFTDITAFAVIANNHWTCGQTLADFDADGDVDWLVFQSPGAALLYVNDGTGVFTDATATSLPAGFASVRGFAADIDRDGDLDVVHTQGLLLNTGNAVFVTGPAGIVPPGANVHGADVDGDGRIDLLTDDGSELRRNLGGLSFAAPVPLPVATFTSFDFDRDGDVDLLGASSILVNSGAGSFSVTLSGVTTVHGSLLGLFGWRAADLDGDGDADLALVHGYTPSVYANFRTQVQTPQRPEVGQPYVALYHGSPGTPTLFGPAVASGGAQVPVPPFGTLRLDGTAILLGALVTTSATPAVVTFTIPNQPALVGFELHHQGVVFEPTRAPFLTNAVRDVVQ